MNSKRTTRKCFNPLWPLGRSYLLWAVLLASLAGVSEGSGADCLPPPSGLIGWWPAEGTAADLTGANDGTLQGTATAEMAGMVGAAFSFDGTNGFVGVPDTPLLRPTNFTIEAWVRFASLESQASGNPPAGQQYIVFKQNSRTTYFEGFVLNKVRQSGGDYFAFGVSSAAGQVAQVRSTTPAVAGVWYHVAGLRGSNVLQLYVNGRLEGQATVSFPQDYGPFPLYFGSTGQAYHDRKLNGQLDEVSLYNRALSADEIAALYAAGSAGKCKGPIIVDQPQGQSVVAGANVLFTVTARGSTPLAYQWQHAGMNLTEGPRVLGANQPVLTLRNLQAADAGNYQVVITNSEGAVTSAIARLELIRLPAITTQPASQTVTAGSNVTLTVVAAGSETLSYRWRFNGTNLAESAVFSGTASPTLSIRYALPANSGAYSVVVTNPAGAVTSTEAFVTVVPPTGCLLPPPGLVGWWPGDGSAQDIVGTNHGILRGGATAAVQGVVGQGFRLDGTNQYVEIPDSPVVRPATLSVECWVQFKNLDTPGTSVYPGQQYLVYKQNTRRTDFEGYVLSKDRTWADIILWEVSSAAGKLVRIDSVSPVTTNVWYHLVGVRGSNYIQLYFNGRLEAQTNVDFPQDYGPQPLYFGTSGQAYYDRKLNGILDEVGLYDRALSAEEIAALYAAGPAGKCKGLHGLTITAQPQSQTLLAGTNASFSVVAAGLLPLGYQWQFNGVPIPGATDSSLLLTNVQALQTGAYRVLVTNAAGMVLSEEATLSVLVSPVITLQPTSQKVWAGAQVSLSVAAIGGAPLSYQWHFNGLKLEGAIAKTLSLTNVQPQQAGAYSVSVSSPAGTTNSAAAILEVLYPPQLLQARTLSNGAFALMLSGPVGYTYQVEVTTNLVDWARVSTLTNLTGQTEFTEPVFSTNGARFYRVRMEY